jgi:transcriptional regulator with XRE-family HTH domain
MNRKANGASISTIRKALGIPQMSLAGRAGITKAYMSQIESGIRQPAPDVLRRIADQLGVTLDAISYPVPEPEPEAAAS